MKILSRFDKRELTTKTIQEREEEMEHVLMLLAFWVVMAIIATIWLEMRCRDISLARWVQNLLHETEERRLKRTGIFTVCLVGWPAVMLILLSQIRRSS